MNKSNPVDLESIVAIVAAVRASRHCVFLCQGTSPAAAGLSLQLHKEVESSRTEVARLKATVDRYKALATSNKLALSTVEVGHSTGCLCPKPVHFSVLLLLKSLNCT